MSLQDEIRNSAEGQSLTLARSVADALRRLGWRTREGAAHASGLADVAATRTWERRSGETTVHLVIRCAKASRVLFSDMQRETRDVIASYTIAESETRPPAAPRARVHAATFRADEEFSAIADDALASIDAVLQDLRDHDAEDIRDDVEAGADEETMRAQLAHRRALVHAIVVTDASLWTVGERIAKQKWLRLHRARVVGADERWIDVVTADAFEPYAAAITRHYASAAT
ncbi:MAG TPA: hypothetical protein VJZ00_23955 [Thermoanaerobaculia bacterium]|nr:hypothetical protein [Thermoanaerobaculia bacterium]